MKYVDPFVKPEEDYKQDINPLGHYVKQASLYLSLQTGQSVEACREYLKRSLGKGGRFEFKDTPVKYLLRQENGDRVELTGGLMEYVNDSLKNRDIIAPTFTTYIHPDITESVLAGYVDGNIALRNKAKKAMFAAKARGDKLTQTIKKTEQTNRKLSNNALSGAHSSESTPLFNKTAHSTLTSICRTTSGYGNGNNEKLLSGNRHYYNYQVIINNITSIISEVNYDALQALIEKYGLHYPSAEDVMKVIRYSSDLYWRETVHHVRIAAYVDKLSALQRAAFVYLGDFYQLMQFNEAFVRNLIDRLSTKIFGVCENPDEIIKEAPESIMNLAHQICTKETAGIGKDYTSIRETEKYHTLALTVANIIHTTMAFGDVFSVICTSKNLPAEIGYFPESLRRAAITSDTDSTIFTVQDWIIWFIGQVSFSEKAISVQAVMTFIASSSIVHVLATMSANLGVARRHLWRVAMKSEFRFDVFVATQIGKTYYAAIGCQEGNVFTEHEMEIKGVQLKSSNNPADINAKAQELIERITATVIAEKKISIREYLNEVREVEQRIISSIQRGESAYLKSGSIKDSGSYSGTPEESPYQNHLFWNETFGTKYGMMPEPPYGTQKVSLLTDSPTLFKQWLENMEDKVLAKKIVTYMEKKGRTSLSTFHAPGPILLVSGFPAEIRPIINYRKIVYELCKSLYLILETLGYYTPQERLVSDLYEQYTA